MTQNINDLIEKINQEGVRAAKDKASQIEELAQKKSQEIIEGAKIKAKNILAEAEEKIEKMSFKQKELIAQAARDMLIALREEINNMLSKIIIKETHAALSHEAILKIICGLVGEYKIKDNQDIIIELNKDDYNALKEKLFSKLKEETKKQIILRPSLDIKGGFIISFDANKSHYDFSDKALAEYIGNFLKPKLNEILQSAISR